MSSPTTPEDTKTEPAFDSRQVTWFSRNWVWFVPSLLVAILAITAGCFLYIGTTFFDLVKSTEPYRYTVKRVKKEPAVIEQLGEPIEDGLFVMGGVASPHEGFSVADIVIPLSGPKGKGKAFVYAVKQGNGWEYQLISFMGEDKKVLKIIDNQPEPLPAK